jgi:hypothetical protein
MVEAVKLIATKDDQEEILLIGRSSTNAWNTIPIESDLVGASWSKRLLH